MTGFARIDGSTEKYSWTWEVKSVNSKGLDLRFRMPHGFDQIEAVGRKLCGEKFTRGNLSINLTLQRPDSPPTLEVNREVLDQMISLAAEYKGGRENIDVESLLSLRGVIEVVEGLNDDEAEITIRDNAVAEGFAALLEELAVARHDEGLRLVSVVDEHVEEIASLTADAAATAEMQPARHADRLKQKIDELLQGDAVPTDRLAQEIALLVARSDVREELDRLSAHVAAARDLMTEGGAIGRRFDFLCQEFNREANTLCAKSSDLELTRVGLALKASIERLREQIQNIE
jgi:uncharacterized protein (TIGR00255 family)